WLLLVMLLLLGLTAVGCQKDNDDNDDDEIITVDSLTTEYTDKLKLTASYKNKDFLADGIGEVTLLRVVDGDTAHFLNKKGDTIKIRFLNINTPESTGVIAAWGKKASSYTKIKLQAATEIVLESEVLDQAAQLDSTGGRYLGYVWYRLGANDDLRLLNLEIIEQCFSYFTGDPATKYGDIFGTAFLKSYATKLRVFGETDPDFSYSSVVSEITIAELKNNYSSYSTGSRLKMTVRVVRLVGNSLFVEDLEPTLNADTGLSTKAGIFLYHSFVSGLGKYLPGYVISFECQASDDETYGTQLVNPKNLRTVSKTSEYSITDIGNEVTNLKNYEGFVVRVLGFKVNKVGKESDTGAFTIYGTMRNGAELMVRVDADANPKIAFDYPQIGSRYDVIGGVSKYVNAYEGNAVYYQLKLGNLTEQTMNDFVLSENQK
ncbi:MAG TPA: thermonuclease family protein, partial [Bacilli bacterium]|nr:thermonuclease family protein [Bacilli bacterium]